MYDQAFSFLDFGYGSAISFLLTTVVLALAGLQYVVTQRRAGMLHVIVGDHRQRIAGMGTRYAMLIAAAVVLVLPFVYMVSTSLKSRSLVLEFPPKLIPDHPTTANYTDAWGSQNFGRYFLNSTLVAIATTALTVLLAAMMAYGFARFDFPGRRALFAAVIGRAHAADDGSDHPAVPARREPADARQALRPGAVLRRHAAWRSAPLLAPSSNDFPSSSTRR
jgi:ABC-type spermidine/putrescine transport system permease subunit I